MIEKILLYVAAYYLITPVVNGLCWLFVKLVVSSPWAPWNGPKYDDALLIEPHKDGFIRVHQKGKTNG